MRIDQAEIHRKTRSDNVEERIEAAQQLGSNFAALKDKKQAWDDLHRLIRDTDSDVREEATDALGSVFPHVPDKSQAWDDLIRLTEDVGHYARVIAVDALGSVFPHVPDKSQAWNDLVRLTGDTDSTVRWRAADALGSAFPHVPDKSQAWNDLHQLTGDTDSEVRVSANHALGKVAIFKATEAETEDEFRKEIETAIAFFEKSSREASYSNPARFCLPFYRSFYTVTFKKQDAETEVQNYLIEAKRAAEGSASKEQLLEAVENLAGALKEVHDTRGMDFDVMKRDLNAYRRYCERAVELLDTTEEQAPSATRLIRKGLPIIDQRIKEILGEIQEKTAVVCRHAKGTSLEPLGHEINQIGKNLLLVRDPIGLEKQVEVMEVTITSICNRMTAAEREDACELLKRAKLEPHAEDKLPWFNAILSKIPAQLSKMKDKGIIIKGPVKAPVQIVVGNGNVQKIDVSARSPKEQEPEKRKSSKDEQQAKNDVPYSSELESEISDIFKSVYQKEREKGESDVNSKTLTFLKTKLHDLAAAKSPFKWLDVGCGYGRALDVLDAVTVPRDMFEYHGIDAVHNYLDDAEEQARKHKLVHWKVEKIDAAQMDFDSEFDLISAVLLLHEVDPLCLPYVIRNMIRALKPEGTLVISDFQGPYEQEEGIVAWSAEDIEHVLESICEEAKSSFEPLPAGKYPKELGFYACYVKKSNIDDAKFEGFMENYKEFLEQKKTESKELRNELRRQLKEHVTDILGRADIDTKNITEEEMEKIKGAIEAEYGIKAHKIRLLTNQIEFLDDKLEEFNSGARCAGVD